MWLLAKRGKIVLFFVEQNILSFPRDCCIMPLTHFGVEPRLLDTHIFLLTAHWVWLNLCHCSTSPSYLRHHSPIYICIVGEVDLHKHLGLCNHWRGWFDKMLNCSWFRSPSLFRNRIILWPCLYFLFCKGQEKYFNFSTGGKLDVSLGN